MMTLEQLRDTITRLNEFRAEYGRADRPFEFQAVCIDKFDVDGHREMAEAGVTDNIVIGLGDIKGKPTDFFFHLTRT